MINMHGLTGTQDEGDIVLVAGQGICDVELGRGRLIGSRLDEVKECS